jgi:hypothetical protein
VILGRLTADAAWLGVDISYGLGETLSSSVEDPDTGDDLVAALCPPGQTCQLVVRAEGGGAEPWVPFTLNAEEAALTPVAVLPGPATSRSLTLRGDLLYLVGPLGLRIMRASTLDQVAFVVKLGLVGAVAAATCGRHLCVVRPGPYGFKVVNVDQPQDVSIAGQAYIGAGARDIAVWGSRAYVARGNAGVRLVDVSNPSQPVAAGEIAAAGKAVSVAVRDDLLAVAYKSGVVKLFDVKDAPTEVGTLQASFQLSKVRFVAGQVWLLDKHGNTAEAWRIDDPAAPVPVGTFSGHAALLMTGRWRGTRLYAVDGIHLHVLAAQ